MKRVAPASTVTLPALEACSGKKSPACRALPCQLVYVLRFAGVCGTSMNTCISDSVIPQHNVLKIADIMRRPQQRIRPQPPNAMAVTGSRGDTSSMWQHCQHFAAGLGCCNGLARLWPHLSARDHIDPCAGSSWCHGEV